MKAYVRRSWLVALCLSAARTSTDAPGRSDADTLTAVPPVVSEPAAAQPDPQAPADTLIKRLSPAEFDSVPAAVTRSLLERGCTIPQASWAIPEPHNVIRGRFARPGQEDWAVLCSRDGRLSILIFWDGSVADVAELDQGEDRRVMQSTRNGRRGFSLVISPADSAYIGRQHAQYPGSPEPPAVLDHDGINVSFVGKASMVLYLYEGKWLKLQGAD